MSSNDLSDLSIEELKQRRDEIDNGDFGRTTDHIEEELSDREQDRERNRELLDMKLQVAQAEQAGLSDDPTVEAMRDEIADLTSDLHPTPHEELAETAGIDVGDVESLSDEEAEQAESHVEAIEMLAGGNNTGVKLSLQNHREDLEALLESHTVGVEALSEHAVGDATEGVRLGDESGLEEN